MLPGLPLLLAASSASPPDPTAAARCSVVGHAHGEHTTGVGEAVHLAWQLEHPAARGVSQRSFELEIDGSGSGSAPLRWRSGAVESPEQRLDTATLATALVLPPGETFRWRVRAGRSASTTDLVDQTMVECEGSFETAPAAQVFPGAAKWIGGGGQLHATKGFALPGGTAIQQARAYVSGVGAFYLYINGQQVGENVMDPPQSVYSKRVLYETFDIAPLLKPGHNDIDVLLGTYKVGYTDMWCNMTAAEGPDGCRALILRISATMADGSEHILDTSTPESGAAFRRDVDTQTCLRHFRAFYSHFDTVWPNYGLTSVQIWRRLERLSWTDCVGSLLSR